MAAGVVTVSKELPPVGETETEAGSKEQAIEAEAEQARLTLPSKPLTGDTVTLKLAGPPCGTVIELGLAVVAKSTTCNCAVAVCEIGVLMPVTVS